MRYHAGSLLGGGLAADDAGERESADHRVGHPRLGEFAESAGIPYSSSNAQRQLLVPAPPVVIRRPSMSIAAQSPMARPTILSRGSTLIVRTLDRSAPIRTRWPSDLPCAPSPASLSGRVSLRR